MIDINEILHCSITSLDLRQSFEIGVNACTRRENRPISSNHFRFVIRGGQRLEARPEKVISDFHLTFSINPAKHSRLEIRWYRGGGYREISIQPTSLRPLNREILRLSLSSSRWDFLLHPSVIIIYRPTWYPRSSIHVREIDVEMATRIIEASHEDFSTRETCSEY